MFSLDFGSIFSGGWQRFISNIGAVLLYAVAYYVGIFILMIPMFIVMGPAILMVLLGASRGANQEALAAMLSGSLGLTIIIGIIVAIVSIGWCAGFMFILKKLALGQNHAFGDMFSQFRKLLQLIVLGIIFGVGVAIGTLLLIIPGIFLMVMWSQSFFLVIDKNVDAITALQASWKAVMPNFWLVLGILVVWYVIAFVAALVLNFIPIIGALGFYLLVQPFLWMVLWVLYFALFPLGQEQLTA